MTIRARAEIEMCCCGEELVTETTVSPVVMLMNFWLSSTDIPKPGPASVLGFKLAASNVQFAGEETFGFLTDETSTDRSHVMEDVLLTLL